MVRSGKPSSMEIKELNLGVIGSLYLANMNNVIIDTKTKPLKRLVETGKATYDKDHGYLLTNQAVCDYVVEETERLRSI